MSWLLAANVINRYNAFVGQVWDGLTRITEPVYRPIRRWMPNTGPFDLTPLVVLIIIFFLSHVISELMLYLRTVL